MCNCGKSQQHISEVAFYITFKMTHGKVQCLPKLVHGLNTKIALTKISINRHKILDYLKFPQSKFWVNLYFLESGILPDTIKKSKA